MKKDKNSIFSHKYCTVALSDFNQSLVEFIQSCYLQLMLVLLYDSLILVVSWTVVKQKLRRKEVESFALHQFDCVQCKMHRCTVLLKYEIVINDAIIASRSNIC